MPKRLREGLIRLSLSSDETQSRLALGLIFLGLTGLGWAMSGDVFRLTRMMLGSLVIN